LKDEVIYQCNFHTLNIRTICCQIYIKKEFYNPNKHNKNKHLYHFTFLLGRKWWCWHLEQTSMRWSKNNRQHKLKELQHLVLQLREQNFCDGWECQNKLFFPVCWDLFDSIAELQAGLILSVFLRNKIYKRMHGPAELHTALEGTAWPMCSFSRWAEDQETRFFCIFCFSKKYPS
jgi:hypothetical protein